MEASSHNSVSGDDKSIQSMPLLSNTQMLPSELSKRFKTVWSCIALNASVSIRCPVSEIEITFERSVPM